MIFSLAKDFPLLLFSINIIYNSYKLWKTINNINFNVNFDKKYNYYINDSEDNKNYNNIYNKRNNCELLPKLYIAKGECYLMAKEFNYTINVLDKKLNAIYKLCKYTGN
jgi:hypothetical protein